MSLYKRGRVYWYNFEFQGKRYQGTTRLRNERQASQFEAKVRSDLALGLVGLTTLKPGPRFDKYATQFRDFVRTRNADHPRTVEFYEEKLDRLLEYPPLAECRLHAIDEKLIEEYVRHRRKAVQPATVNRELATLRRALRLAWSTFKLIPRVPIIQMLTGEIEREFVLNYEQEKAYLAAASDTLRDFAILSLDTGVRVGEALLLEWEDDVSLEGAPNARLGYIRIRERGRKKRGRILSITPRVRTMLETRRRFLPNAQFVFPGRWPGTHMRVSSLDHLHVDARTAATVETEQGVEKLPNSFVIHSLRHTFGTRLGMCPDADAFTIMKVMGHSTVTISQKYVHPTPERMERAFEQLESMNQILRGDQEAERKLGVPTKVTTPRKREP
jgi:integrase